jgi:hypothetical protein
VFRSPKIKSFLKVKESRRFFYQPPSTATKKGWVRLFIFAQNTFHLCWSKKNFLSLLPLTFYLCYSSPKDFSPWLLTSQPLLIFFEIYTQKVKILAIERAVCGVVKNEIYMYMQKVEISVRESCV